MIKKVFKKHLNRALNLYGLEVIRKHDREYLLTKNNEYIEVINKFFDEFIFPKLPDDPKRKELVGMLTGTGISLAFYLLHYLRKSLVIKGAVCEFGVANGATSALIANEIIRTSRHLWLFDSFRGLSEPTAQDKLINDVFSLGSMSKYEGTMGYSENDVRQRLIRIGFPEVRTHVVAGYVENTLHQKISLPAVCFAYVDVDLYRPTETILEFLHPRLTHKGCIVIDDYGYFTSGVKTAVDQFVKKYRHNYKIITPYKFAGHFCILEKTG